MRMRFAVALALTLATTPAGAADKLVPALEKLLEGELSDTAVVGVVKDLGAFCASTISRVPPLSPREEAWLAGEYAAGRYDHAAKTTEASRKELATYLRACLEQTVLVARFTGATPASVLDFAVVMIGAADMRWHMENLTRNGVATFSDDEITDAELILPLAGKLLLTKVLAPRLRRAADSPNPPTGDSGVPAE